MYRHHTVGVVIPAYNEEAFIGDVVRDLPDFVDAVFLVDDASTDGTWEEMRRVMNESGSTVTASNPAPAPDPEDVPREEMARVIQERASVADGGSSPAGRIEAVETVGKVTRLRHSRNRGAGGAVKTGYLAALHSGVDVITTIDADGQMDSDRLSALLDPLVNGEAGYAKGNRFADRDALREMPPFRLVGNVLLTGLTRIASGYWDVSDPQNGFTAVRRDALRDVDVEGLWEYYGYMNQLMAQLNTAGVRIADVPMPAMYGDEESSIDYRQYIRRVSLLLLVSFLRRIWAKYVDRRPHPTFVGYAVFLLGAGSVLRKLLAAGRARDGSLREAATRAAVSVTAFATAAALDRTAPPTTSSAENVQPTGEPALTGGNDGNQ